MSLLGEYFNLVGRHMRAKHPFRQIFHHNRLAFLGSNLRSQKILAHKLISFEPGYFFDFFSDLQYCAFLVYNCHGISHEVEQRLEMFS